LSSDESGTSEGDLVNVHVRGDGSTGDLSETRNDVDDTGREAGLLAKSGSVETRQGSLFGGLDNDGVATGNSGTNLPSPHEKGEVPGDNLTTNTNRLFSDVVEGIGAGVDNLTLDLVCPTTIVSQAARGSSNITLCHGESLSVVERLDGGKLV